MASVTGFPERTPATEEIADFERRESEPLLGRPGDAVQEEGGSIFRNLVLGGYPSPSVGRNVSNLWLTPNLQVLVF